MILMCEGLVILHDLCYITGIQRNLHIVLIMDCTNSNFTLNCESNPAFYKRCAVQWMDGWSRVSMYQLPATLLTRGPKTEGASLGKEKAKRPLSGGKDLQKAFLSVHESMSGSTPRRYMSFLRTYQNVYKEKKGGIEGKQRHLEVSRLHRSQRVLSDIEPCTNNDQNKTKFVRVCLRLV